MAKASGIGAHMEVRAADGSRVGTVNGVEGDRIKLTHHYVNLSSVERVDEHVHLSDAASVA
ncbi:MAG TPA: DUF2171 domain-containing protein [Allosphingosinicella sp.]